MLNGQDVLLRLDVQGAATVRKLLGQDAVFIFMVAESEMALVKRLVERKTKSFGNVICTCNFVICTIKYTHTCALGARFKLIIITRGVSHYGLAICLKKYLKAKEELWKLKYFRLLIIDQGVIFFKKK